MTAERSDVPVVSLRSLVKVYDTGEVPFTALKAVDLDVYSGEFVGIIGKSGSGKTTLINMITGIDHPTSGEVMIGETPVHKLGENALAKWRGRNIGVVFQFFQLLPPSAHPSRRWVRRSWTRHAPCPAQTPERFAGPGVRSAGFSAGSSCCGRG